MELSERCERLTIGVITGANQRSTDHVRKFRRTRVLLEPGEGVGRYVSTHRQVARTRLQVLADREHVHVVPAQFAHHC